jgi:ech hydrogenase subunit A
MNAETLVATTILFPALTGLACLIAPKALRRILVIITGLVMIGASLLVFYSGGFTYTPNENFELVIVALDVLLLGYFLYQGYTNRSLATVGLSVAQIIPVLYFEYIAQGTHVENTFVVDGIAIIMTLIVNIIGSMVILYATSYMDEHEEYSSHDTMREKFIRGSASQGKFFFFMILLLGAMNGLVYSNNMYWLYFFWEVTTLSCYELIRHDGTEEAINNGIRALWMGLVGGVAFIGAIFISYYTLGSIALSDLLVAGNDTFILLAIALLAVAAFTKSAQLPFHSWLLGAMVAPTPVSALLHSSTMVNAGVYLVLRFAPSIAGSLLSYSIALVGIFTFMITAIIALSQRFSKSILAYSTIGNLGLMIFCACMNTPLSYSAAFILLVFHAMSKGLLFMCAGVIENRLHTRDIEKWQGLLETMPMITVVMIIGIVSMFLPMFGILLGKWAAVGVASSAPIFVAMVMITLLTIGSSATTHYWARWLGNFTMMPLVQEKRKYEIEPLTWVYKISIFSVLLLNIILSLDTGYMIQNLLCPAVEYAYVCVWNTGVVLLTTHLGNFMILPIWLTMFAVLIIGYYLYTSKKGKRVPVYLSGANVPGNPTGFTSTADQVVEFNVSNMFFDPTITESRWNPWAVIAGIILNLVVLVVVML